MELTGKRKGSGGGRSSRAKGQRGERQWRDELRAAGFDSERNSQYTGGHIDGPDVSCSVRIGGRLLHWEVKRTERFNLYNAIGQAVSDCGEAIPVVVTRRNASPWVVVMRSADFLELLRAAADTPPVRISSDEKRTDVETVTIEVTPDGARAG